MIRLSQPLDNPDPAERPSDNKTFADCVLATERQLSDVQRDPNNPELWHILRLQIQNSAVRYVDSFGLNEKPMIDQKDIKAMRSVLEQAVALLPEDADPKLRNWLETVPQITLLCDDRETLRSNMEKEIAKALKE
ncbi:hypothetical protein KKF55_00010 [Patescibacteria group bacterium]|nr:hypothetical protein [Patescibacteria group bacterium]